MSYLQNISAYEHTIFKNSKNFKGFENITMERRQQLELIVHNYKRLNKFQKNHHYIIDSNHYRYNKILECLVSNHKLGLNTLDEKIFFLINTIDPNCRMYELYLSCPDNLNKQNKESIVRNNIGFFSNNLLKYEYAYMVKFRPRLLTDVNKDYSKKFFLLMPLVKNFDEITEERFENIANQAILYKEIPHINLNCHTCTYNILYQSQILGLTTMQEKLIFFIQVMDPELQLLKIYYEESTYSNIQMRSQNELGFYFKYLISAELLYCQKFFPNKKISEWTL